MATWPQWVIAAIHVFGFVSSVFKEGRNNDRVGLVSSLIAYPGVVTVLYFGGFWSVWGFAP